MTGSAPPRELLDVSPLEPIGLDEVRALADLQTRHDAKYVVERAQLPRLLASMGDRMRVLEVAGRRSTSYVSVYFDTPDLRTYRDHLMSRRRRFKIRTRHYGDPGQAVLELKLKGPRGQTLKHRWPHVGEHTQLGADARERLAVALDEDYGFVLPDGLHPVVQTRYRRTTLVDPAAPERVTIDEDLTIVAHGQEVSLGADHVVVETKATALRGAGTRTMSELGLRPDRVSKYCVAVASSYEDVRGNPWLPVLRRLTVQPVPPATLRGGAMLAGE